MFDGHFTASVFDGSIRKNGDQIIFEITKTVPLRSFKNKRNVSNIWLIENSSSFEKSNFYFSFFLILFCFVLWKGGSATIKKGVSRLIDSPLLLRWYQQPSYVHETIKMTVKSNLLGYFFYFAFIFTLTLPEGLVCCPCSCPCALFRRLRKVYHVFLSFFFFLLRCIMLTWSFISLLVQGWRLEVCPT